MASSRHTNGLLPQNLVDRSLALIAVFYKLSRRPSRESCWPSCRFPHQSFPSRRIHFSPGGLDSHDLCLIKPVLPRDMAARCRNQTLANFVDRGGRKCLEMVGYLDDL